MKCKFELEHIGINTPNPEEAEKLSSFSAWFLIWSPVTARSPSLPEPILSA